MKSQYQILLTCEHGGNAIPYSLEKYFQQHNDLLNTHRGYDIGAIEIVNEIAEHFNAPLFLSTTSRLVVDLNRSLSNQHLFSEITNVLSPSEKTEILKHHYYPYRNLVEEKIHSLRDNKKIIIHFSIHTFTPILHGVVRQADIGLLYDPKRSKEKQFCMLWKKILLQFKYGYLVRQNYPYQGRSDGFTTHLRSQFSENDYLGIEIEINQKFPLQNLKPWRQLKACIIDSLTTALTSFKRACDA